MKTLFLSSLLTLALTTQLTAQAIPGAVFTAGTTTTDAQNRPWAYLAFRPADERVLVGRSLAIYLKNGLPGDPGSFVKMGIVAPELEISVLSVLLERGRQIGEDLAQLDSVLYDLYRTRTGDANSVTDPLPAPPKPPLPEMLSSLLMRATADAETAQLMRVLGQAHPAVKMALGEGWAGPLSAAPGQPVTLEVREWSTAGDGGVVGRVTLTAGQPVLLPAPGPPVQLPDLTPKGDLNIKLRWGQDEDLRRQSPLSGGFTVWRVLRSFAATQGVEAAAPSLNQLRTWMLAGDALRVSNQPVLASKLFSTLEAADFITDKTTYFLTDDGKRYRKNLQGEEIDDPMIEGAEYTYFVTSRDILGRDGPPSLPGHGIVCRTLPPPVPSDLRVENYWEPDANATTGTQSFQFFWKSNTNNARDVTNHYEIYRGTDLRVLETPEAKLVYETTPGPIAEGQLHQVDGALMSYLDVDPEVLGTDFGETFWYSIRAVHISPLGPIKSDYAAPVLIARRQREGPEAPSGIVDLNCHRASVIFAGQQILPVLPVDGLVRIRLLCQRLDNGIAHADLSVRIGATVTDLGQHLFPAEGDFVAADFEIPENELNRADVIAICQTTSHTGVLSNPKEITLDHLNGEGRREVTFQTKTMSDADLIPGEVFSNELLEAPVSVPVGATNEGLGVAIDLDSLAGRTVIIQTSPAAVAVPTWTQRGHGGVREGRTFFSVAPVAEGQQQPALSGRVFAIREFGDHSCVDLAFNPSTGQAGKLGVVLFTTARSTEYRLFRRINEGPYTLVGQGGVVYQASNPVNAIRREDEALPVTDCTICYYAQTVDRDGNASALVRLEPCIERKAPTLPKPRLSPPAALGTAAAAKMKLTWMCPPEGVERFVITLKAKGGPAAKSLLEQASAYALTAQMATRVVLYHGSDTEIKLTPTQQASGPANQPSNGDLVSVLSLATGRLAYQKMVQTSSFVTPPLGNGFPAEPPFTAEFDVQPGVTYTVFVQASRGLLFGGLGRGPASATYEFKWEEPTVGPEPAVAWPARPMPDVLTYTGIEVAELDPVMWPANLNGQRPVGIRLASMLNARFEDVIQVSNEVVFAPTPDSPNHRRHDPNAHVFRPLGNGITQVQGVVMYRQQVVNSLYPSVSGDTIQVSPLVRKIAWIPTVAGGSSGARLIDPFFGLTMVSPPPGTQGDLSPTLNLWLLDTQGVVESARYHYYLVCFGADGEITQTIDAGFYGPN